MRHFCHLTVNTSKKYFPIFFIAFLTKLGNSKPFDTCMIVFWHQIRQFGDLSRLPDCKIGKNWPNWQNDCFLYGGLLDRVLLNWGAFGQGAFRYGGLLERGAFGLGGF